MPSAFMRQDVREFLQIVASANAPKMSDVGAVQARDLMSQMRTFCDLPTGDLAVIRDIEVPMQKGGAIPVRFFDSRSTRPPGHALLYIHGGGFVLGDLDHYEPVCAQLAREMDVPVLAVDYRLAPEFPWPAAPDDCEAVTRWVAQSPAALDRRVTGLILAGDSAGGTLSLVTAMALRDRPAAVPVIAQMLLYPVTDLSVDYPSHTEFQSGYLLETEVLHWFYTCYGADRSHWRASPLLGRLDRLPPTLIVTAGLDPLRDEGRAFAAAAVKAGVATVFREATGMIHGFVNFRKAIPSAVEDLDACLSQLKALVKEVKVRVLHEPSA